MKPIKFMGRSLEHIKKFPDEVKQRTGYQLNNVQKGHNPTDFKPMKTIGPGVQEIRISEGAGIYRVVYVAKFAEAVYVLHAFQKKSQKTSAADLDMAKRTYKEVLEERKYD